MFEHHKQPLLPTAAFLRRMVRCTVVAFLIFGFALAVGMLGYHHLEHMPWLDAFANSSMLLSGMGPLMGLQTDAGKIFAGFYALFSGLVFVSIVGVVFAPVAHRLFHAFHLATEDDESGPES